MNTLTYRRCWELGKLAKEKFNESWESWTKDSKSWDGFVNRRKLTKQQLFYCKLGVEGRPFQDTSLSDETGDILDDEIMQFGKHKGSKFGSLSPNYLRWFLEQTWAEKWPTVVVYAKRKTKNLDEAKLDKETVRQMLSLDDD